MKDYGDCRHEWGYDGDGKLPFIHCPKCGLTVEIYHDHVSLWDYTRKGMVKYLGAVPFPEPSNDEDLEEGEEDDGVKKEETKHPRIEGGHYLRREGR